MVREGFWALLVNMATAPCRRAKAPNWAACSISRCSALGFVAFPHPMTRRKTIVSAKCMNLLSIESMTNIRVLIDEGVESMTDNRQSFHMFDFVWADSLA